MIQTTVTLKGFENFNAAVDRHAMKAAAYRTINRTTDGVVTDLSTEIRRVYNVKKSDVDPRMKKRYCADYENLNASVTLMGGDKSALPLVAFNAVDRRNLSRGGSVKTLKGRNGFYSQMMKKQVGQQGVTYQITRGGGKGFSGNAFIIPGGGGSLQVVRRLPGQKGRYALKEKRVVSVVGMVKSRREQITSIISAMADQRMAKNFEREVKYYESRVLNKTLLDNT